MKRMTDEQRELASQPWAIAAAYSTARGLCLWRQRCGLNPEWAEVRSAALHALCEVVADWKPDGGRSLRTHVRALLKLRTANRLADSWGRRGQRRQKLQTLERQFAEPGDDDRDAIYEADIPSADLPVGWEVESEDAVRVMCRAAGGAGGQLLERQFLAAGQTVRSLADSSGMSRDWFFFQTRRARADIAARYGGARLMGPLQKALEAWRASGDIPADGDIGQVLDRAFAAGWAAAIRSAAEAVNDDLDDDADPDATDLYEGQ